MSKSGLDKQIKKAQSEYKRLMAKLHEVESRISLLFSKRFMRGK